MFFHQALSSLSYLLPQIDAIHEKAEQLDVPTPVIDALQEVFQGGLFSMLLPWECLLTFRQN